MKYILFGTGKYCKEYASCIDEDKIMCYIDNSKDKQGELFKGKKVYSVDRGLRENYDYIVIMIKDYSQSVQQLVSMGVSNERIILYDEIWKVEDISQKIVSEKGEKTINEWILNRSGLKIFVCSHDFTRTGVPVALMNLTILLQKMDCQVLMGALKGGALEEELSENGIDYICDMEYQGMNKNKKFMIQMRGFDIIILGTLALAKVGGAFSTIGTPVLWWIHESIQIYYDNVLPDTGNIFYYGVGRKVLEKFNEYYPEEKIEELLYYLPDTQSERSCYKQRRTFAVIGRFDEIKAQDILMRAIIELPAEIRDISDFYFVGKSDNGYGAQIDEFCGRYNNVFHICELSQKEIVCFYHVIDVLVCPSRDDSMPIVVTQAMQNGIPCLVSDQVGQSLYIREMGGGCVFQSENVTELKECLIKAVSWERTEWEEYSRQARGIFDSFFSEEVMRRNIQRIMGEILGGGNL